MSCLTDVLLVTGGTGLRKGKGHTKWEGPPGANTLIAIHNINRNKETNLKVNLTF